LGEIKQFFLDLIGKFHEKSFFRVFSKSCLLFLKRVKTPAF
jgi:hypothetical protein